MMRAVFARSPSMRPGLLRRVLRDVRGVALVEFAYALPFLTILGLGGIEVANYSITHMRISQIAVSLADNASRAKEDIVSGTPRMREYDVNEAFLASSLQSSGLDIANKGRLILTSLETNGTGGQYLHWQRCFGLRAAYSSSYGKQGDGITGTKVKGMGPAGLEVKAETGYAIMFAEVYYDYEPLILDRFIPHAAIRKTAAMYVRDDRDLAAGLVASPGVPDRTCPAG
jgi:hypothetical protein